MIQVGVQLLQEELYEEQIVLHLQDLPLKNYCLNKEDEYFFFSFQLDINISNSQYEKDKWLYKVEDIFALIGIPFSVINFDTITETTFNHPISQQIVQGSFGVNSVHRLFHLFLAPHTPYSVGEDKIHQLGYSIQKSLDYDNPDHAYDFFKQALQNPQEFKYYIDSTCRIYGNETYQGNNQNFFHFIGALIDHMDDRERDTLINKWQKKKKVKQQTSSEITQTIPSLSHLLTQPHFPRKHLKVQGIAQNNHVQVGIMQVGNLNKKYQPVFSFNPYLANILFSPEAENLYHHLQLKVDISPDQFFQSLRSNIIWAETTREHANSEQYLAELERKLEYMFPKITIDQKAVKLFQELILACGITIEKEIKEKKNIYSTPFVNFYVEQEQEQKILQIFKSAKKITHPLANLPDYSEWATLSEGTSLQIKKDGLILNYVPHNKGEKQTTAVFKFNRSKFDKFLKKEEEKIKDKPSLLEQKRLQQIQILKKRQFPFSSLRLNVKDVQAEFLKMKIQNQNWPYIDILTLDFYDKVEEISAEIQTAVRSEKGRFTVYCETNSKREPEELLKELEQLGIVTVQNSAPNSFNTPITPIRKGKNPNLQELVLPPNTFIVHGLTGCELTSLSSFSYREDKQEVIQRLKMIVESGGLIPTRDRRQMGYDLKTTSPSGDIASGIDGGIACSITQSPQYGNSVFFICKSSVLYRDKVWFAPYDFGAGNDRFEDYQKYAKSIGQDNIFSSPSIDTRQEHFDNLYDIDHKDSNEIWFEGGLNLNEIGALLINQTIQHEVEPLIEEWRELGYLDESLKVKFFEEENLQLKDYLF